MSQAVTAEESAGTGSVNHGPINPYICASLSHTHYWYELLFLTFSALAANPKKTTLHGGQSRSWSAEQGKKKKKKKKKSGSAHRYFQHAHFIPIVGVGKRGEY